MRALVQRVSSAQVEVGGQVVGRIGKGLLVYLAVAATDGAEFAERLAEKIVNLRVFPDEQGALNLSVLGIGAEVLAVSNFTLMGDARKGRRPSFAAAAGAELAEPTYQRFVAALAGSGVKVASGSFGQHMHITSVADGPVNVLVEFPPDAPSASRQPADKTTGQKAQDCGA
jgi:D-tyrosyl-tRNA(Tyr) deacylase